jgi:hypothetical protein
MVVKEGQGESNAVVQLSSYIHQELPHLLNRLKPWNLGYFSHYTGLWATVTQENNATPSRKSHQTEIQNTVFTLI